MRLTRILILLVLGTGIFAGSAAALEITVIGPDGKPVVKRAVKVLWEKKPFGNSTDVTSAQGTTDADGKLSVGLDSRIHRLTVVVKGVGFCSTGHVEIIPGRTAAVTTPRLARFATIEGSCDPRFVTSKSRIWIRANDWRLTEAKFDKQGRFVLRDVVPGESCIRATGLVALEQVCVRLLPGQRLTGVVFKRKPKTKVDEGVFNRPRRPLGSLKGRVADEHGKPIAGAKVFAVNEYHGGMRMYRKVSSALTGEDGKYTIAGINSGTGCTAAAAFVKGRPLALKSVPYYGPWGAIFGMDGMRSVRIGANAKKGDPPPVFRADLAVAEKGGGLDVKVLTDGKPVAGALVRLEPDDWHPFFSQGWARNYGGKDSKRFFDLLRPIRKAGADGVARFEHLPPGTYTVNAIREGKPDDVEAIARSGIDIRPAAYLGRAERVTVAVGERRSLSVKTYRRRITAKVRLLDTAGNPLSESKVSYSWGSQVSGGYWSSGKKTDEKGVLSCGVSRYGLWTLEARLRDSVIPSYPVRIEPYYLGRAQLAFSGLLERPKPVDVRLRHVKPGSIRLRLQGLDGKPIRGAILDASNGFGPPEYAASTDEGGVVTLPNMPSGKYAFCAGPASPAPVIARMKVTVKDAELKDKAMFPRTEVQAKANQTVEAVMRLTKAGFVRGTIKLRKPKRLSTYSIQHSGYQRRFPVRTHVDIDHKTGEFLCGPIVPGEFTLWLWYHPGDGSPNIRVATRKLDVKPGTVTRIELVPLPKEQHEPVGTGTAWSPVRGTVLLADGKTPAYGARVQKFVPDTNSPVSGAITGADGAFMTTGLSVYSSSRSGSAKPDLKSPVVVAWLPGHCGPVIVPVKTARKEAVKITLPPPLGVAGTVTVGGKPATGFEAAIRVVAVLESRKVLSRMYTIQATADADGQFRLDGLLPGKYRVQAALDDIWVSKTISLNVSKAGPKKIKLDILALGDPIVVEVQNEDGKPLAHEEVKPLLPAGPLMEVIHQGSLTTDGAGKVRLEGLPAGKLQLRILRTGKTREITVPALR